MGNKMVDFNQIAWKLNSFPSKPTAYLKMMFPKTRKFFGALSSNALTLDQVNRKDIQPDEVRVSVKAISLNFRDYAISLGLYSPDQSLPFIPCSDASGLVTEIGTAVKSFKIGDRVITHYIQGWNDGPGTAENQKNTLGSPLEGVLQSSIIIPEQGIILAPNTLDEISASTLPIAGLTAWSALTTKAKARPGEILLVQGSGGVSLFAIQLGKALGLNIIAITSNKTKANKLSELGADKVIIAKHGEEWSEKILSETKDGVDIILDVGGGSTISSSSKSLKHGGRIVSIGFLGGINPKIDISELILKNASIQGITVGNRNDLSQLSKFIDSHQIKPIVDSIYSFKNAPLAFARIASGNQFGNVCIEVNKLNDKI